MSFVVCAGFIACTGNDPVDPPKPPQPDPEVVPGNDIVVYQANEKLFARTAAFKAVDARLDEIDQLGVNVLWLMPIHPIGQKNTANSPYCVKDFKGINSNFGTLDDLKTLVNHAHAKGMKVILDWIANHSALDHPWMTEHPNWYGTPSGEEMNWKDVQPFNFNNKDMRAAMIDAMTYWVHEADIDGFRCDFAQGCPDDFWKEAITAVRAIKPEAIMLAETSRIELYTAGFDWLYSWSYLSAIQKLMTEGSIKGLYAVSDGELDKTPAGKARLRYITNHDACSEVANRNAYRSAEGMLAASCLTYFLGGVPLIYSSQEIGYLDKIDFCTTSERSVLMDWSSNPQILKNYKKLMAVYHETAKLRGGELTTGGDSDVALLTYKSKAGTLMVMVNIRGEEKKYATPMALMGQEVKELITGKTTEFAREITLGAYEYKIYSLNKN